MVKVMFVCTSNVFRSLSAHYLLKKYLEENKIKDIEVGSSGIFAKNVHPDDCVISTLKKYDIDVSKHISKKLNQEMINEFDVVVSMAINHQEFIEKEFNVHSPLFNEIVFNKKTSLMDNFEIVGSHDENPDGFDDYEIKIIEYIYSSLPQFVENVRKFV